MSTCVQLLDHILGCKEYRDCEKLNTIVLDIDFYFDKIDTMSLDGVAKAVYNEALDYLKDFYEFAASKLKENPNLYDGSILEWDSELLMEAINLLDPKKDLNYGFGSSGFYLELDYWDLYANVIDEICQDYNAENDFGTLEYSFTKEFYGGKETPKKYAPLID